VTILLVQRGEHDIEDELTFTNHDGYIFHDSRGFEAGDETELKIVQDFVRRRSQEGRLGERLHAIWFVSFGSVPVIATSQGLLSGIAFRCPILGHRSIWGILTKFARIRILMVRLIPT
jgi:hypothetical protein